MVREIVWSWLSIAAIPGVQVVYPGMPMIEAFDAFEAGTEYGAILSIHIGDISEDRVVTSGPNDPGGKDLHCDIEIILKHVGYNVEPQGWMLAENDHDRILEAVKDRFRGGGRDLGRPDVITQAGDWPAGGSIRSSTGKPVWDDGVRTQWSSVFFLVSYYMPAQPQQ